MHATLQFFLRKIANVESYADHKRLESFAFIKNDICASLCQFCLQQKRTWRKGKKIAWNQSDIGWNFDIFLLYNMVKHLFLAFLEKKYQL